MIRFGPYFYPTGLKPEITCTFQIISEVSNEYNLEIVLTSSIDRKHKAKSLHYVGLSVDISWPGFHREIEGVGIQVRQSLASRLGTHYDVVLEDNCIHIECQPKTAINEHWRQ